MSSVSRLWPAGLWSHGIFEAHFFDLSELTPQPDSDTGRNEDGGGDGEEGKVHAREEAGREYWGEAN